MRILFSLLSVGAILSTASATTLYVDGLQSGKYDDVHIKYNGNDKHVNAGTFAARLDASAAFDAYCVDLDHTVSPPSSYAVNLLTQNSLSNGALVGRLYNMFSSSVDSSSKGAGLQMAIWDAIVDGGDGFAAGNFIDNGTSGSILTKASNYLTAATLSPLSPSSIYYYEALDHPGGRNQNLVGPVPEPGTMIALGMGLVGAFKRRAKRS